MAVSLPELNWIPGSDWINVQQKGVKGNGIDDDTAALQKILTNLHDGQILYFPAGTYVIKNTLIIEKVTKGREKRLMGNGFYGHGKSTVFRYDGPMDKDMLEIRGMLHFRMVGFVFDGQNKALSAIRHRNFINKHNKFQTHLWHQYMELKNCRQYGIQVCAEACSAETTFANMIFDNCNTGAALTRFNDYNFSFDGCTFKNNKRYAVECEHGNFYVRNSRFENNHVDVYANPEHACSIRRSVSTGSDCFLEYVNGVSPMTVQNCLIADWKGDCAIRAKGAPLTMFDNTFRNDKEDSVVINAPARQILVTANNAVEGKAVFANQKFTAQKEIVLPGDVRRPAEKMTFMPERVELPSKVFDAVRDFGARHDGKTDDTDAIQKTIDAAREYGKNAIAYLPVGKYRISKPLEVAGSGYLFGGASCRAMLVFCGKEDDNAVNVRPDGELKLCSMTIVRDNLKDLGKMKYAFGGKGSDIRQYPSAKGSKVLYDNVYVTGKYKHLPFQLGFCLEKLGAKDMVILNNTEGNIRVIDSGAATIYQPVGYEGTIYAKGKARGGFFGVTTRLATIAAFSVYIEDSHPFVASDFYIEQAMPKTLSFFGKPGDPKGGVTIGCVKLDQSIVIDGYQGYTSFAATQTYGKQLDIYQSGTFGPLAFIGSYFYIKKLNAHPETNGFGLYGSGQKSRFNDAVLNFKPTPVTDQQVKAALLDLRKLGETDKKLNVTIPRAASCGCCFLQNLFDWF